ncbi:helix-turn-helix transcriptional regulator [Methylophaga sp.]|uniref:helix-turn-helix transcriptional regulator n=1 Tax=Methylophaga sp. TaxID=2024840 RepID=UPI003A918D7F
MSQKILKLSDVKHITRKSGSAIYRDAAIGKFPKPIKLGQRSSGWLESEIQNWLQECIETSRCGTEG